jgi:diguanylate cyclase (GGDEF)-like protein
MRSDASQLALLNEVGRIAVADLDLRPMLQRITDLLRDRLRLEFVACHGIDLESRRIVCEAMSADRPVQMQVGDSWPLEVGVVGSVALSGEPVLADDVSHLKAYMPVIPETRAELCVPVRHGERVVAVINVERRAGGTVTGLFPLVQAVADQVAGAVAGARLYEELKQRAGLTEMLAEVSRLANEPGPPREVVRRLVDYIAREFEVGAASVLLLNDAGTRFIDEVFAANLPHTINPMGEWSISQGIGGRCVRLGRPVLVPDVRLDHDYLPTIPDMVVEYAVPIRHGGRVLGVLNLESSNSDAFPPYAQRAFVGMANQVAGALATARLAERLRQHAALLEMLNRLGRLATEDAALSEVLKNITDLIAAEFDVAVASILLLDETGQHFTIETMSGWLQLGSPTGGAWPIQLGICGRCAREGVAQFVSVDDGDPDYIPGHPDIVAEYVVPLRVGGRVLGVLNIESMVRDNLTPELRQTLDAIADQIAGAIHLAVVNQRLSETHRLLAERTGALGKANADLKRANLELRRLSGHDQVTDIPNRRRFDEVLRHEWRWAARTGRPLAVMLADLDHFKALNDTHGHPYGDACLRSVAQCLLKTLDRAPDFVARYGGEEFALVLPDLELPAAQQLAERLRAAVEALGLQHKASAHGRVTISIGVAVVVPERRGDPQVVVGAADAALYAAKAAGRNRVSPAP